MNRPLINSKYANRQPADDGLNNQSLDKRGRIMTLPKTSLSVIILLLLVFAVVAGVQAQGGLTSFNFTSTTTDKDGNNHLGDDHINDVYFYDTTQDSDGGAWRQGGLGKFGSNALRFDGNDDMVNVPTQVLQKYPDFSYAFWLKPDNSGDVRQYILGQSMGGANNNYCLAVMYDITDHTIALTSNGISPDSLAYVMPMENWTYLAVTSNYAANISSLYINGKLAATGSAATCTQDPAAQFRIGKAPWSGFNHDYKGLIDEIRVYNRVLTSEEIQANMYSPTSLHAGIVADWHLDEETGTAVQDTSGNGYDGSFSGASRIGNTSWYTEEFSFSRGQKREFPDTAYLIATDAGLDILDAEDNTLWMRFDKGNSVNEFPVLGNSNAVVRRVFALDGKVYLGLGGDGGLRIIDFTNDAAFYKDSSVNDDRQWDGTIATRNGQDTFDNNWTDIGDDTLPDSNVNDVHAAVIDYKTFVAVATDRGVNVLNQTDGTFDEALVSIEGENNNMDVKRIFLAEDDTLYLSLDSPSYNNGYHQIRVKYNQSQVDLGDPWNTADWDWTYGTVNSHQPINDLLVTEDTSTVIGSSNTIYVATDAGVTVIDEKQGDEANSISTHYTTADILEGSTNIARSLAVNGNTLWVGTNDGVEGGVLSVIDLNNDTLEASWSTATSPALSGNNISSLSGTNQQLLVGTDADGVTLLLDVMSGLADLNLTLESASRFSPGGTVSYDVVVHNNTVITAPNIVLTHTLPLSITFEQASIAPVTQTANTLVWEPGNLAAHGIFRVTITGTISPTSPVGSVLTTTATVTSDLIEANLTNNTATFTSTVVPGPAAHLEVTAPETVDILAPFDLIANVRDTWGNLATNYTGTIQLESSDPLANLSSGSNNQGVFTFPNVRLRTPGAQVITVTDGIVTSTVPITVDDTYVVVDTSTTWDAGDVVIAGTLEVTGTGTVLTLVGSTTITAENVIVGPGAQISADGQGYPAGTGPDGQVIGTFVGGSYGGIGGLECRRGEDGYTGTPLLSFGSVHYPNSGGGAGGTSYGGWGGGAIHFNADQVIINGVISANGNKGSTYWGVSGGGGAGGSIWIETGILSGNGYIMANGNEGGSQMGANHGGAGGGGRVAIYVNTYDYEGDIQVATAGHCTPGEPGTIYLGKVDPVTSTIEISPASIPANGVAQGLITVTLRYTGGQVIAGEPVSVHLKSGTGSTTFINGTQATTWIDLGTTNADGVVTAVITSTTSETKTIEATSGVVRLLNTADVYFDPDLVEGANSSLAIDGPSTVAADGLATVTVIVTVRDRQGNENIPGITTTLSTDPAINIIPIRVTSDNNGEVEYQLSSSEPGTVVVTATVGPANEPVGNSATVTFRGAELAVSKTGPDEATAGFPIDYHITVANEGLMTATNVLVTDTLPAVTGFISQTSSYPYTYTEADNTVVWQIDSLPAGASDTFILRATVAATATGTIVNRITGGVSETESDLDDNEDSVTTVVVQGEPDLQFSPGMYREFPVLQGETGILTGTLTNAGTAAVSNLQLAPFPHIPWATVEPDTAVDLGIGEALVYTVTATTTAATDVGLYRDIISVTATNLSAPVIQTEIYVHPDLTNLVVPVKDGSARSISGATVAMTKTTPSIRVTNLDGSVLTDTYTVKFGQSTDANGKAFIFDVEAGTYNYTVNASGYQLVSGIITITSGMTGFPPPALQGLPDIVLTPNQLHVGVQPGGSLQQNIVIRNSGYANAANFTIETPNDLLWVSSDWPEGVTTLAPGEAVTVTMLIAPPEMLSQVSYREYFTVTATNEAGDFSDTEFLAAAIDVSAAKTADYTFNVTELGATEPLSGAVVSVVNQGGRLVGSQIVYDSAQLVTGETGQTVFNDLPLGKYTYQVRADGYYSEDGVVEIMPLVSGGEEARLLGGKANGLAYPLMQYGGTGAGGNSTSVSLEKDPFAYTWTVEEIEGGIVDAYTVTVDITYEATVPEPALFVSPIIFCPGNPFQFMVANAGAPVTMTNIAVVPEHKGVTFTPSEVDIASLGPGKSYTGGFSTAGDPDKAAATGWLHVTAQYQTEAGTYDYETSALMVKLCVPEADVRWSWTWDEDENTATGSQTSSYPNFPGNSLPPAPSIIDGPEQASLTLSGEATLERQAFLATLRLDSLSDVPVQDIRVDIRAHNAYSQTVVDGFVAIPEVPTELGTLAVRSSLMKEWTLIPGELGITDPAGEMYAIDAQIVYTYNSVVYTTTTLPALITVLPQPRVKLTFSHNQPNNEGEFYLQVHAENQGYGVAKNLTLDLSKVSVLPDLDSNGRSLLFDLLQTTLDGQTRPTAWLFDFGDMQPDEVKVGRWDIDVDTSDGLPMVNPRVTGFEVTCEHRPYEGQELSDLLFCGDLNQYYLAGECPFCGINGKNEQVGGPINTANGNYHYEQGTPSIPTVSDPLELTWSYNSLQSGAFADIGPITTTLGVGWTHNYDLRLDFSRMDDPATPVVVFKAFHGTPLQFEYVKGEFRPAPGVHGSLVRTEVLENQNVYTLTAANQATYIFNNGGRLAEQYDPQGNVIQFSYNPDGALARVQEPVSGRYLDFGYDAQGRLQSVTDPISRVTTFGYDGQGLLTTITDTRGEVWDYGYTTLDGGQTVLSQVTDPDGRTVEQTGFDDLGRAVTQTYRGEDLTIGYYDDGRRIITDGAGRETYHIYNRQNILVSTFDALGQTDIFVTDENYNRIAEFDKNGNPTLYQRNDFGYATSVTDALGNATTYEYDANNNLVRSTDAKGNVTLYLYDGQNNLISTTNSSGTCSSGCSGDGTTTYTYNDNGQTTGTTDALGNTTRYGYDAIGQRAVITDALGSATRFEYDGVGRLIRTIDATGKITLNEYDGGDNLVRVTENYLEGQAQNYQGEYNIVTEYGYDGLGHQVMVTDTLGHVNRSVYDEAGRLEQSIQNVHPTVTTQNYLNEYNLVTEYVYNEAGNLVESVDTLGRVNRTEYDARNRTERSITHYVDGVYDPAYPDEDLITRYEYDAAGNLVSLFDVAGRETRTEYDELNRTRRTIANYVDGVYNPATPDEDLITTYTYDEVGNQQTVTDPLGRVTTYAYDEQNRVSVITNPLGGTTGYTYDAAGRRLTTTDAEGRISAGGYDALGRAVTTTNAIGGQTITVYDEAGRRAATIDANGHSVTFSYDSLGRVIATTDAEGQTTSITYNALGQRQSVTDAEGNATTFEYDSLGRATITTNALSGTTVVSYDALGQRQSVTDANGHTTTFSYDQLGRAVAVTDANGLTTRTVYNGLGQRVSATNDAGETTEFEYDDAGRLVLTRDPLGHETTYRYNGAGSRVALTDANGVETRYEYDDLGRLTAVIGNYGDGVFDAAQPDQDIRTGYTYDGVGNRLSVTDANAHTTTYTYDALNRRTESSDPLGNVTRTGYDGVGNRAVITDANGVVTTFDYDNVNRLTGIDYSDDTPDVTFGYNGVGQRVEMADGIGVTTYTWDSLYRLTGVNDGAGLEVGYDYDNAGNRTSLTYPDGRQVSYAYDDGNRLESVTDWHGGQFEYNYDQASRLTGLTMPDGVVSSYNYNNAGQLTLLTHDTLTQTLASYAYSLDDVGNRTTLTETLLAFEPPAAAGVYLETDGTVALEAENGEAVNNEQLTVNSWLTATTRSGYTGTAYVQALPDLDVLVQTDEITASPQLAWPVEFTTPGTYTVWVRGMADSAGSDSLYIGLAGETVTVTGFAPRDWDWAGGAELVMQHSGLYTINVWMREDGLRLDRLLLTTDTTTIPTGFGPAETPRQQEGGEGSVTTMARIIDYGYDDLYRLTSADYTSGEQYTYTYDPVGNRLQQIINGDTTDYLYDAANRLASVDGVSYTFDANGNLLTTSAMTNTWDAANRLVEVVRNGNLVQPIYNGVGDRVAEITNGLTTTHFALDIQGLPEVIYTDEGNTFLHLPGVIVAESAEGEVRYLLSDGLGSVRQAVDETGTVVASYEFDPYGNAVDNIGGDPYGYTGEWYGGYIDLLFLRARWYAPETGTFLSVDPVETEPPYQYVRGNVMNRIDPSGLQVQAACGTCGPDATLWFSNQVKEHFAYGSMIRGLRSYLVDKTLTWPLPTLGEITDGLSPFQEIANQIAIGGKPLKNFPATGYTEIQALGVLEYALYGLAVDYTNIEYDRLLQMGSGKCGSCTLSKARPGAPGEFDSHQTVTLCGKCIDTSDIGNVIFGVGGRARGYDLNFTYAAAQGYNFLTDFLKPLTTGIGNPTNPVNADPLGAIVGWNIAGSSSNICASLKPWLSFSFWNDNANQSQFCRACKDRYIHPNAGTKPPSSASHPSPYNFFSSLYQVGRYGNPTIPDLINKVPGLNYIGSE